MTTPEAEKSFLNSLARGLEVIVVMGRHDSLSISELAGITGMNRWQVRRIVLTLEALGYVGREGRRLRLRPKVLDLGYAFMFSMDLWKIAAPLIVALVDEVQLTCTMSVLEGHDIVYLARRTASAPSVRLPLQVGSRVPAHCTASGRVLLCEKSPEELSAWLAAAPLAKVTALTETDPAALRRHIKKTRREGWCRVDNELAAGSCAIALPVRDCSGKIMAAISLSGMDHDLRFPRVLDALRETANRIESVMHQS
ncbi:MAG: helix-turn-helix domain-containing protein [Desulfovibrio sp.]|nr:helix-turn-helix domain-containing protein [Desulfovibrio sp.]